MLGGGAVVAGIHAAIDAASNLNKEQALLAQSMKVSGISFADNGAQIEAYIEKESRLSAFTQGDLTIGEVSIKAIRTIGLAQVYFLDTKKAGLKRYVAEPGKFMDKAPSLVGP
jgi:4-hydroxyphenylpyruvate dioxygenase-like putative hemolysin